MFCVRNDWSCPCFRGGPTSTCKYNLWRLESGWAGLGQCFEHSAKQLCDQLSSMQAVITAVLEQKLGAAMQYQSFLPPCFPWKTTIAQCIARAPAKPPSPHVQCWRWEATSCEQKWSFFIVTLSKATPTSTLNKGGRGAIKHVRVKLWDGRFSRKTRTVKNDEQAICRGLLRVIDVAGGCDVAHVHLCTYVYTPAIFQQSPCEHVPAVGHCFYAQACESTCAINEESVHLAIAWWL